MRPYLIASLAVWAACLPASAIATVALDCTGKRGTPDVTISLGADDWVFKADIFDRRPVVATPHGMPRLRQRPAKDGAIDFDVLISSRTIWATVRVAPTSGHRGYVGTMMLWGRKYWLQCGDPG